MKNNLRFCFLGFALTLTVLACKSEKKSFANDTSMVDTVNLDTMATDTVAKDSTVKRVNSNLGTTIE